MNYGIVSEFNPFHNGHKFLIDSLKNNPESTVTVVISESFVQRGESAILSPSARVEAALKSGVDLIISLPVPYATASAERFAKGGVSVLGALGCIDALAFGSECGDEALLIKCAEALETSAFSGVLAFFLNKGLSFPDARQKALTEICGEEIGDLLSFPNNILAVEYIKSIKALGCNMGVKTVARKGVAHDSAEVAEDICSASALREMLKNGDDVKKYMPLAAYKILSEQIRCNKAPADFKKLEPAMLYKLRTMTAEDFKQLPDISEGLEYRFADAVKECVSIDKILEKVKTKRYTHSRLRRILLCALLGIKSEDVSKPVPYIRALGFNEKGAKLLSKAKETAKLPIVTKSSDVKGLGDEAKRVFQLECTARDIFSLSLPEADPCGKVMTDKLIVL